MVKRLTPFFSAILLFGGLRSLSAHESLYNTAEIHLTSPEEIAIHFSIHAPEILHETETGSAGFGDEWLAGLDDRRIGELIEKSRFFVRERYRIHTGKDEIPLQQALQFEAADLIRTPQREGGPRPGCLLATLIIPNHGGTLTWEYAPRAEKRLLLVEIRPARFPKTHDLEAGSSVQISLPDPPPPPIGTRTAPLLLALAFTVLIGMVIRWKLLTLFKAP